MVRALAALFRHVEAWVHIEPRIYRVERLRPDLEVTFPDQTLLIDVAIAHPAAPSRSSALPLAATAGPEREKIKKYKALAMARDLLFSLSCSSPMVPTASKRKAQDALLGCAELSEAPAIWRRDFRRLRSQDCLSSFAEGQRFSGSEGCRSGPT